MRVLFSHHRYGCLAHLPQIGPFSPNTLARSPLPPKLRAANLTPDEEGSAQRTLDNAPRNGAEVNWSAEGRNERDEENESYSRAATLLLAARERVLSLAEQRVSLQPVTSVIGL